MRKKVTLLIKENGVWDVKESLLDDIVQTDKLSDEIRKQLGNDHTNFENALLMLDKKLPHIPSDKEEALNAFYPIDTMKDFVDCLKAYIDAFEDANISVPSVVKNAIYRLK